jgi:hypothetical protein
MVDSYHALIEQPNLSTTRRPRSARVSPAIDGRPGSCVGATQRCDGQHSRGLRGTLSVQAVGAVFHQASYMGIQIQRARLRQFSADVTVGWVPVI